MYTEPRMETLATTADRYRDVHERVDRAARRIGRTGDDILTVAVTKYAEMDQVRELMRLGHRDFGESRVQQLVQRAAMIDELIDRRRTLPHVAPSRPSEHLGDMEGVSGDGLPSGVRWHLIGHLQRNKVKKLVGLVRLIHSVDSLRLVEEIQSVAFKRDEPVEVMVQVNCAGGTRRHGCAVAAAAHLCEQIDTMIHLRVRGLMTMAPYSEDPEESRSIFERCHELFEEIRSRGVGEGRFNILSMGMSGDFEVAIECGSNMVRIGTALFGDAVAHLEHEERDSSV